MAVKIKLKRIGKIRTPHYRVIVADSRTKRDGRAIEEIGRYNPKSEPSLIEIDSERAQYWLSVGAQPTEPVAALLRVTGDWQKFKGEPGAEGTLKVAEPKADRRAKYDAILAEVHGDKADDDAATKKKSKKTDGKKSAKASTKKDDSKKDESKKSEAKADKKEAKAEAESDESAAKSSEQS